MSKLTFYERQKIEYLLKCKLKLRKIAKLLRRDHSVIVREVNRNKPQFSDYQAVLAQRLTENKSHITNTRKIDKDWWLRRYILDALKHGWSPEQIAGRLDKYPPPNVSIKHLCMETIYQYIYTQDDGCGAWYRYLRRATKTRQPRYHRKHHNQLITDKISIHDRPKLIGKRKRVGDWETDLLCFGRHRQALSVQYERKTQYANLTKLDNKKAISNHEALLSLRERFPTSLVKSITFDNGSENALHLELKYDYNINTYFCDSYSSWQKGGVENLNGLLRYYLPKKINPNTITDEHIRYIEELLNTRPRKKLGYLTPAEVVKNELEKLKVVH